MAPNLAAAWRSAALVPFWSTATPCAVAWPPCPRCKVELVQGILLGLAEVKLNQPSIQLKVQNGLIRANNGAQTSYWELVVGESLNREATGLVRPVSEHRYIGRSVPRPDIQAKVMGQAIFVQEQSSHATRAGLWLLWS